MSASEKALGLLLLCASCVAMSQTVDDLTEAKRRQLLGDAGGGRAQSAAASAQAPVAAPSTPAFGVVSIFGINRANLNAVMFEGDSREYRVSIGSKTLSGWEVQDITPSTVVLKKGGRTHVAVIGATRPSMAVFSTGAGGTAPPSSPLPPQGPPPGLPPAR